jgi:hypothetical protein
MKRGDRKWHEILTQQGKQQEADYRYEWKMNLRPVQALY